ncbi:hypothetical protein [Streptomyces anulatus]|uniref:hypothetical protein n=1 Tax=Streptomyces anulatus TaxID=1892 RepID=UPI00343CD969
MPRTTAFASVTGFAAGVALTIPLAALAEGPMADQIVPTIVRTAGALCILLAAGRVFRVWLNESHARTCEELRAAAEQRQEFQKQLDDRTADLARRETRLAWILAAADAQHNEAQHALLQETAARMKLEAEYDELAEDYNTLVASSLQQSAALFRPRETRPPPPGHAPLLPMPLPVRRKDVPRPKIEDARRHDRHDRATSPT